MLVGFGNAPTKSEGSGVEFDNANEAYTARYSHETVALAFALTEEAIEDNLYDRLGALTFLTTPSTLASLVVTALSFARLLTHLQVAALSATSHQQRLISTKHRWKMR